MSGRGFEAPWEALWKMKLEKHLEELRCLPSLRRNYLQRLWHASFHGDDFLPRKIACGMGRLLRLRRNSQEEILAEIEAMPPFDPRERDVEHGDKPVLVPEPDEWGDESPPPVVKRLDSCTSLRELERIFALPVGVGGTKEAVPGNKQVEMHGAKNKDAGGMGCHGYSVQKLLRHHKNGRSFWTRQASPSGSRTSLASIEEGPEHDLDDCDWKEPSEGSFA